MRYGLFPAFRGEAICQVIWTMSGLARAVEAREPHRGKAGAPVKCFGRIQNLLRSVAGAPMR